MRNPTLALGEDLVIISVDQIFHNQRDHANKEGEGSVGNQYTLRLGEPEVDICMASNIDTRRSLQCAWSASKHQRQTDAVQRERGSRTRQGEECVEVNDALDVIAKKDGSEPRVRHYSEMPPSDTIEIALQEGFFGYFWLRRLLNQNLPVLRTPHSHHCA